jgi:predicted transposase/invertase (TIGR01784 family)
MMKENTGKRNPLSPRNDHFFKRLFGDSRDKEILTDFLKAALDIPADEYGEIEIVDPSSKAEHEDDKLNVIDVKLRTKSGKIISIELQRFGENAFRERIVFEVSKLIEEQISSGDHYGKIHAVICIVITEFTLINENEEYHNRYAYHDSRTGSTFSDIVTIHTFELSKLDGAEGDEPVLDWLRFLDSDEVESMEAIAEKNEGVRKAVTKFKELTASEYERMTAAGRAKDKRLEAGRLAYAKDEGRAEGHAEGRAEVARNLRQQGVAVDLIAAATGLSADEIEQL